MPLRYAPFLILKFRRLHPQRSQLLPRRRRRRPQYHLQPPFDYGVASPPPRRGGRARDVKYGDVNAGAGGFGDDGADYDG